MSTLDIIIIVVFLILIFGWGLWFTAKKFRNIEEGETNRRSHIEHDIKVDEHGKKSDK